VPVREALIRRGRFEREKTLSPRFRGQSALPIDSGDACIGSARPATPERSKSIVSPCRLERAEGWHRYDRAQPGTRHQFSTVKRTQDSLPVTLPLALKLSDALREDRVDLRALTFAGVLISGRCRFFAGSALGAADAGGAR
jgi:hypothetical protein